MCSTSHFNLELGVIMYAHISRMSDNPLWCNSLESSDHEDAISQRCHRAAARAADPRGDGHRRLGAGRGRSRADPHSFARPARLESNRDHELADIDHKAPRADRRAVWPIADAPSVKLSKSEPSTIR